MSRLIVLSNRVKMPDNSPMVGGLAVALHEILIGDSDIWLGWNGKVVDNDDSYDSFSSNEFEMSRSQDFATHTQSTNTVSNISYLTTALTTNQYQHFYCGFANNVLWSLLHEQPELITQAPDDYAGYQAVNRLFAEQLIEIAEPDDIIWVHDYHFLSVAYYCRQLGMQNRIGFFLHIPFAPLLFWQQLDKSVELLSHLTYYNVIGTQTQQDKANCIAVLKHYLADNIIDTSVYEQHFLGAHLSKVNSINPCFSEFNDTKSTSLVLNWNLDSEHYLKIGAYPIGINVEKIQNQVAHLSTQSTYQMQNDDVIKPNTQQIVAVDRIDYSKGLLERFSVYERFLQHYPIYQNQLNLLQIACPSRLDIPVYRQLYNQVKQTVDEINDQFLPHGILENDPETFHSKTTRSKNDWQPITYSEQVLSHNKVMKAFWHSDIGWVNSLKDGMNLVAKEYIAAQNPDNPGVLMLSKYAGAAEQMQAAIIIDPHQPQSVIKGLKIALQMPLAERKSRHRQLMQGLESYDLQTWQRKFLNDLRHSISSKNGVTCLNAQLSDLVK